MSSRLRTPLCEKIGIDVPVMVAGMGSYVGPELAAAVSNAGGLGVLGATGQTGDDLRRWIRETKSLTDRPFAVDLILPPNVDLDLPPLPELEQMIPAEQKQFVEDLRKKYSDPRQAALAPEQKHRRRALPASNTKEMLDVMFEEGVPIFVSGLGSPAFLMDRAREADMTVMSIVGNVKSAKRVTADGVDVVIAQGAEGGGHTGRIGTMALIPQVIDAVAPVPVIAAGGIGDGRGLAAALAMGCQAVWCGSAFIPTHECRALDWQKQAILRAEDEGTIRSKSYTGKPCRALRNEWIAAWEASPIDPLPMPLQMLAAAHALLDARPDDERVQPNIVGQVAGLLKEIKPAAQVVNEMIAQAEQILERLSRFEFAGPVS